MTNATNDLRHIASSITRFISKDESAQYFEAGYSCDNALLVRLENEVYFITDSRYTTEAKQNLKPNVCLIESHALIEEAIKILVKSKITDIYFDSAQLSVEDFNKLESKLPQIRFQALPHFHQLIRAIKTQEEIHLIRKSQALNKKAYKAFGRKIQKESLKGKKLSEIKLHALARRILEKEGKYPLSFNPIVGINKNAAKPHALPSADRLKNNDLLLFDAGIKYRHYCSDMTRTAIFADDTICFSKTQKFKDKKLQRIYDIVRKAQEEAIKKLRAGMNGKQIDAIARDVIAKAGYGEFFTHSTGHGIGLDIHEFPFISSRSETIITDNMVFSIEPGIYIPNHYGVRIEDLVVVKNGRAEIL